MNVVIVGVGAAGSMASWRLASAGHQVTAFEQFEIDHDRGSSYGDSRIVRRVYPDPTYTRLMQEAYVLWDELQKQWRPICPAGPDSDDAELICRSGGLFIGPSHHPDVVAAESALKANRVPHIKLTAKSVAQNHRAFRIADNEIALYEPSMGYARASHSVQAAVSLARRAGACIRENMAVREISPTDSGVNVVTEAGDSYCADSVVLTAGAWTKPLMQTIGVRVPLRVTRQVYVHLQPETKSDEIGIHPDQFPVWIDAATNMYGFPRIGSHHGIKIASHNQGELTNPDTVNRNTMDEDVAPLMQYARSRFVWSDLRLVHSQVCLYTNTPDQDFLIGTVPGMPRLHLISACSGHGFKFAPLLGEIARELVEGRAQSRDLSRFHIAG